MAGLPNSLDITAENTAAIKEEVGSKDPLFLLAF